jgi:hypothetical protein
MLHHAPDNAEETSGKAPLKVMANVFLDVHGVILVDFTLPGPIVNVAASQETLKRLKRLFSPRDQNS